MRPVRFYRSDVGVLLETPIPLTPMQRHVAAEFAIKEYKRRLKGMPDGHRRDELLGMITDISRGNYAERPIPAHDYEKEAIIHG